MPARELTGEKPTAQVMVSVEETPRRKGYNLVALDAMPGEGVPTIVVDQQYGVQLPPVSSLNWATGRSPYVRSSSSATHRNADAA